MEVAKMSRETKDIFITIIIMLALVGLYGLLKEFKDGLEQKSKNEQIIERIKRDYKSNSIDL